MRLNSTERDDCQLHKGKLSIIIKNGKRNFFVNIHMKPKIGFRVDKTTIPD